MTTVNNLVLSAVTLLALSGCGGGSGGSSGPSTVTVTPAHAQVLAGATQQMSATAADGGLAFTWQVNGTSGGNSALGKISASGLYTAPSLPPAGGTVTITAIEQSHPTQSGTAVLTLGYSNASLAGGYVFELSGLDAGVPWSAIGEFSANGAGQMNRGQEDINSGANVTVKTPFNGTYSIAPDGLGMATLGALNVEFVVQQSGSASLLRTDTATAMGGSFLPQTPAAGNVSSLSGPYLFNVAGENTSNQGITTLGRVIATPGGTLTSGTEDVNGPNPQLNSPVTGSYAFDGANHGTLTFSDSTGTHHYSFYVETASNLELLSSDPAQPLSGSLSPQVSVSFDNTSLDGAYVFFVGGNSPTAGYTQAGQFNPNGLGSLGSITEDINTPGNVATITPVGTYSLDASGDGRGIMMINGQGLNTPQTYVFYMESTTLAQYMVVNSNVTASGLIVSQTQGSAFSNRALSGSYGLQLFSQTGPVSISQGLGIVSFDGQGNLTGSLIQNVNGTTSATLSLSGTYSLGGGVRGTAVLVSSGGGSSPFALYPVTSDVCILIGTNAASPYVGSALLRY